MNDAEHIQALRDVYDQIPAVNCKGLCHEACSVIRVFPIERLRMEMHSGVKLTVNRAGQCGYLTTQKRCSVYAVRPWICRLYAASQDSRIQCPFGCRPARPLSIAAAADLFARLMAIGGGDLEFPDVPWMIDPTFSIDRTTGNLRLNGFSHPKDK